MSGRRPVSRPGRYGTFAALATASCQPTYLEVALEATRRAPCVSAASRSYPRAFDLVAGHLWSENLSM